LTHDRRPLFPEACMGQKSGPQLPMNSEANLDSEQLSGSGAS